MGDFSGADACADRAAGGILRRLACRADADRVRKRATLCDAADTRDARRYGVSLYCATVGLGRSDCAPWAVPIAELDAAAEQADPSRRRLSSKKEKKTRSDNGQRTLLLLGALAAAMLLAREIFGWKFKKRPLPAKLRGKGASQPAIGRRPKGEKETPPRSQKNKERSSSTDGNSDQSAKRETKAAKGGGKGSSKASPENHKSEPKPRAESPRTQAKREERPHHCGAHAPQRRSTANH